MIDKTGRMVIPPKFRAAYRYSDGCAGVQIGDRMGFIETSGEVVIPPQFAFVAEFSDGIAQVLTGRAVAEPDHIEFIDRYGRVVARPQVEVASNINQS